MRRPPFRSVAFSRFVLAAPVLTIASCRSTTPSAASDGLPVPTVSAHLDTAQSSPAEPSRLSGDMMESAAPSSSTRLQEAPSVGSVRGGSCPEPSEVDPHDCAWEHWTAIPEEQDRAVAWARSDAARLWAGWCLQHPASSGAPAERLWIPPKLNPDGGDTTSTRQFLDNCSWWSASSEPRPPGLAIVVLEIGTFDYGINLFDDGRAVFQSLRCQKGRAAHVRMVPVTQVARLVAAFKGAKLTGRTACAQLIGDLDMTAVGFYSGDVDRLIRVNRSVPSDAPVTRLADLAERAVAEGTWVR